MPDKPRIEQTKFGKPDGNCLHACLAMLFGVALDDVPDFSSGAEWWAELGAFAAKYGLAPIYMEGRPYSNGVPDNTWSIVSGQSPRGLPHCTLWQGDKLVHDPHPDQSGVDPIRSTIIFVAIDPANRSPAPAAPIAPERLAMCVQQVTPVIDKSMRGMCVNKYPNHPKGCPNFNKRADCPPKAPLLHEILDLDKPVYAVWHVFDFGAYVEKMRAKHPDWTQRQLENCLYWQGTVRKILKQRVEKFISERDAAKVLYTPEACGVNVTETMANIGEILEWPPVDKVYKVALVGTAVQEKAQ